jgi:hypothetical protein
VILCAVSLQAAYHGSYPPVSAIWAKNIDMAAHRPLRTSGVTEVPPKFEGLQVTSAQTRVVRGLKCLTIVDDATPEAVAIRTARPVGCRSPACWGYWRFG